MKIKNLKIKESIVFFLSAVVISVSSCEKIPLGLGGLWTLTDYELHNGTNDEIVPKTDETDAPYGVPAVTSHMMLLDGLLVSYDFAKLPSYEGEEFPDIWLWLIFEKK